MRQQILGVQDRNFDVWYDHLRGVVQQTWYAQRGPTQNQGERKVRFRKRALHRATGVYVSAQVITPHMMFRPRVFTLRYE